MFALTVMSPEFHNNNNKKGSYFSETDLSPSSHVDERDRNPDAISPPRALSPAPCALTPCCSLALSAHASGEIKTLQPSTRRWTEKQPRNIANQGTTVSKKTSRRFSFCGSERSGTIDSFRVKYARVCAFHWTLWYFPQEVFKTSLDRILFGVGRYFTLVHIPPGARALVRSFLLKTTKHGFILYFNGKTLTNCPKLHVTAALQSFPAFIVKEHIYYSPERHIFFAVTGRVYRAKYVSPWWRRGNSSDSLRGNTSKSYFNIILYDISSSSPLIAY